MRKDNKQEQLLSPFTSSISLWNQSQHDFLPDVTTQGHTPTLSITKQSTNLFSQKFKESSNEFDHSCVHHPQKKVSILPKQVKYVIMRDDGNQERICTKCAVSCAQQGCKIEEIHEGTLQTNSEDDVRKKQTDAFIQQLTDTKTQVDLINQQLTKNELIVKNFYNDQYASVVKTFSDVEKALQLSKTQVLSNLSQQMWSAIQITNQIKVQFKQIEHSIITYINDISANYDNIVHHMGTLPFNQIMGGYGNKLFKLQQYITSQKRSIEEKKVPFMQYQGKDSCLETFLADICKIREVSQPDYGFIHKQERKESPRSSSEQKGQKSNEAEKRHQSQPNRQDVNNLRSFENSEMKTSENKNQTFKITEESIEEWMENSSTKQKDHMLRMSKHHQNLQTEPSETIQHHSPNILTQKFTKTQKPQRTSLRQDASQVLMDRLLEGFNQIKKERDTRQHVGQVQKKMSKTPEMGKSSTQSNVQGRLSPKFLFKNYYK